MLIKDICAPVKPVPGGLQGYMAGRIQRHLIKDPPSLHKGHDTL